VRSAGGRLPGKSIAVLIAIGITAGLFSGLFGVGGGILLVPLLMWWARMDFLRASATSLAAILPIAAFSAIPYVAAGYFSPLVALLTALGAAGGAQLGVALRARASVFALELSFGVFLVGIAIALTVLEVSRGAELEWDFRTASLLAACGVASGLAASVFGAGGGVFLVPLLMIVGVGDLAAKSASLIALIPASIIPSIQNLRSGTTLLPQLTVIGLSGVVCAPLGALWAQVLDPRVSAITVATLAIIFALIVLARSLVRLKRS